MFVNQWRHEGGQQQPGETVVSVKAFWNHHWNFVLLLDTNNGDLERSLFEAQDAF